MDAPYCEDVKNRQRYTRQK